MAKETSWELFIRALTRTVNQRRSTEQVIADGTSKLSDNFRVEVNKTALARELGVSLSAISKIFRGKSRPSLTMVRGMSKILGVSSDELCDALGINGAKLREYSKEDDRAEERPQSGDRNN